MHQCVTIERGRTWKGTVNGQKEPTKWFFWRRGGFSVLNCENGPAMKGSSGHKGATSQKGGERGEKCPTCLHLSKIPFILFIQITKKKIPAFETSNETMGPGGGGKKASVRGWGEVLGWTFVEDAALGRSICIPKNRGKDPRNSFEGKIGGSGICPGRGKKGGRSSILPKGLMGGKRGIMSTR